MPAVSEKQRRAMEAAAHGRSTLGIPKKVGEEFVGKDWDSLTDEEQVAEVEARERPAQDSIAFDRATVRRVDQDGHLHVEMTPISKANVCPYLGREIPDFDKLGLDPEKQYRLYRDPKELKKGAASFAGKPLLLQHTPISADDHPRDMTVGSVGDRVEFRAPYLMAPLHIHDGEAIGLVTSGQQKELSSAYRYRADMTPGRTPDGDAYDGVMRDIVANHVALVREGRAGSDVVVGDSKHVSVPRQAGGRKTKVTGSNGANDMKMLTRKGAAAHGALMVYLAPKLAADAKIDLAPALIGVTSKNFADKRSSIARGVVAAAKGKLAQDAEIDTKDLAKVLDVIEMLQPDATEDMAEPEDPSMVQDGEGLTPEEQAQLAMLLKKRDAAGGAQDEDDADGAMDEDEDEDDKPKAKAKSEPEKKKGAEDQPPPFKGKPKPAAEDSEKSMVTAKAMDAAIRKAATDAEASTMKRLQDIRVAERAVAPLVGEVTLGLDSADAIYAAALKANDVDIKGVHASAYPALVKMLAQQKGETPREAPRMAADSGELAAFKKSIGDDRRIRVLG